MADDRPTFGSLFAGIGGIDLGLERAGWRGRWQVEYEPFCQRVLAKHWPDVTRYGDIRDVDWAGVEPVDAVVGGFPCQPFSVAGKRLGKADYRWLWPEFARAVRALRPRYVLVENVPGILAGHGGMGAVLGDLAELGYDSEWDSIPAAAVGAPHLRYRVWIVAHANDGRRGERDAGQRGLPIADGVGDGITSCLDIDQGRGKVISDPTVARGELSSNGRGDPPARRVFSLADAFGERGCGGDDHGEHAAHVDPPGQGVRPGGYGGWWATEPDVGRVAHGVPARVDRLRALGNAVVPQVVEFIGRRILEAEAVK